MELVKMSEMVFRVYRSFLNFHACRHWTVQHLRVLLISVAFVADGLITFGGVNAGLTVEVNPVLTSIAGSLWLLVVKLVGGVVAGHLVRRSEVLFWGILSCQIIICIFNIWSVAYVTALAQ